MKVCVIGTGDGGATASNQIRRFNSEVQIDVFSERANLGCPPCPMVLVLSGEVATWEELIRGFREISFWEKRDINLHLNKEVTDIAREGKYNPVPLNINKSILEAVKVTEKMFEKSIHVGFEFDNDIKTIKADKNQINQVLTNLIINSKDAMPSGGELIFVTDNVLIDDDCVKSVIGLKSGEYVKLSVSDTGVGIPEYIQEKIIQSKKLYDQAQAKYSANDVTPFLIDAQKAYEQIISVFIELCPELENSFKTRGFQA